MTDTAPGTQSAAPEVADPVAAEPQGDPLASGAPPRSLSMPKSPVTGKRADELGRKAVEVVMAIGRVVAGITRSAARALRRLWRVVEAVPPAVRAFGAAAVLMLFGIVGAIALRDTLGLVCVVVVIPVSASVLGALGHRWYCGLVSVEYVDKKLALALTSFGNDHHQKAVIAISQAKTAAELTLGIEGDTANFDVPLRADDYGLRPRIRAGSGSTSALAESHSLAAS